MFLQINVEKGHDSHWLQALAEQRVYCVYVENSGINTDINYSIPYTIGYDSIKWMCLLAIAPG